MCSATRARLYSSPPPLPFTQTRDNYLAVVRRRRSDCARVSPDLNAAGLIRVRWCARETTSVLYAGGYLCLRAYTLRRAYIFMPCRRYNNNTTLIQKYLIFVVIGVFHADRKEYAYSAHCPRRDNVTAARILTVPGGSPLRSRPRC